MTSGATYRFALAHMGGLLVQLAPVLENATQDTLTFVLVNFDAAQARPIGILETIRTVDMGDFSGPSFEQVAESFEKDFGGPRGRHGAGLPTLPVLGLDVFGRRFVGHRRHELSGRVRGFRQTRHPRAPTATLHSFR